MTLTNVDDGKVVPQMTAHLTGFLLGDKGYISKELFIKLYRRGLKLVTGIMRVHIISTLIVYQIKPSKPSIRQQFQLPNP